ncbi:MAG: A24 family peptidase [Alphaproteobacteria bacterium]
MLNIVSVICLTAALPILGALVVIDLRTRLLPNILVLGLAMAGFAFHVSALFYYDPVRDLLAGALIGGGMLYAIRLAGNFFYKTDTLGLGDVKLMAAGGLWLGPYYTLIALIAGAVAGLVHGGALIGYKRLKTREAATLSTFSLPAGPGFAAGLLIAALAKFWALPHLAF